MSVAVRGLVQIIHRAERGHDIGHAPGALPTDADRIAAVLRPGEDRAAFVRGAVEGELSRREADALKKPR